jgi:hypothetical protein
MFYDEVNEDVNLFSTMDTNNDVIYLNRCSLTNDPKEALRDLKVVTTVSHQEGSADGGP